MKIKNVFGILVLLIFSACGKGFLDEKPNSSLVVPNTLSDLQALLDNETIMRVTPVLGELSSDNYYLTFDIWNTRVPVARNAYVWTANLYENAATVNDWDAPYQQIYYANNVLQLLEEIPSNAANEQEWNRLKGNALFIRGYAFYNLACAFAKPYNAQTAAGILGIPLKLNTSLTESIERSSLQATYDQILSDLHGAKDLVSPTLTPSKNRPSKPGVLGLMARIYLDMGNYQNAKAYADSCLQLYSTLIDYNQVDATSNSPLARISNEEVIYHSVSNTAYQVIQALASTSPTDTLLLKQYHANDLRGKVFFRTNTGTGQKYFKGSYAGSGATHQFTGIATDEMYLIHAESKARTGDAQGGLDDLNRLLEKRWVTGTFAPAQTNNPGEALRIILNERRKELLMRGLRWQDLKRLNQEAEFAVTLKRKLNGTEYVLEPNSPKYVFPIPDYEILITGIQQNIR